MDKPYRKFFFVLIILGPLFACALPNFAALAPTPDSLELIASPETARSEDSGDGRSESAVVSVIAPPAFVAVDQLPPAPTVSTESIAKPLVPIQIEAGLDYQITGEATVRYTAAGSRPFVVRLSSTAGSVQLKTLNGAELEDVEVRTVSEKTYTIVPSPFGETYELNLMSLGAETNNSMTLQVFDLSLGTENQLQMSDFVGVEDLVRTKLNMAANSLYAVILQPSVELDAVMELYDTAGIVTAKDEGGGGEPETLFVSSSVAAEWAIVIYSYLDSSGDFTLDVYEIP